MMYADTRAGAPFAKDPAVVRFNRRCLLYYTMRWPEGGFAMGIAESEDLVTWTKVREILPAADYEAKGLCAPGARVIRGQVHLFYQSYGNGPKDAICHAVSDDGLTFERDSSNPIFRPTGDWNNGRAIDADVIPWRDQLWLYVSTRDPAGKIQLGAVAAAPFDSDFSRDCWTQMKDAPTIQPELPWEQECIEASAMVEHDGRLFMFYGGAYNNHPQQIGCAVSDNGIDFARLSDGPFLPNGGPGEWNASESGHPFVFLDDDGTTWLFFQGNATGGRDWYLSKVKLAWLDGRPTLAD